MFLAERSLFLLTFDFLADTEERVRSLFRFSTERRKCWLYETPLSTQHALRALLNSPETVNHLPPSELGRLFEPFDLPILCSVVKLWLLELEVPVIGFSAYDELRTLLPGRIASVRDAPNPDTEGRQAPSEGEDGGGSGKSVIDRERLIKVLARLPTIHLEVKRTKIPIPRPILSFHGERAERDRLACVVLPRVSSRN